MSGARCCCTPGDPSCCEQAGLSWWNRYCLYLEPCTYYWLDCNCGESLCGQYDCNECVQEGAFCCRETEFNFCVRGAIFRIPRHSTFCPTEQSPGTYVTPCFGDNPTPPWVAPDWGSDEGGDNSYYASPTDPNSLCECSIAPVAARIRYQCHYRTEHYAGNACGFEEFDEAYVVEGRATLYCANPAGECELLCSCDEATSLPTPLHILKIEPCETPATGLPTPPTLTFYAQLDNKTPPHLATWTLGRINGYQAFNDCDPIPQNGTAPNWCFDHPSNQGCDDYRSDETFTISDPNFYPYPCQDQDCTL